MVLAAPYDAELVGEELSKHFSAQTQAFYGLSLGDHALFGNYPVWVSVVSSESHQDVFANELGPGIKVGYVGEVLGMEQVLELELEPYNVPHRCVALCSRTRGDKWSPLLL